jgi:Universal stress protein family
VGACALASVHTLSRRLNAPRPAHDRGIAPGRRLNGTIVCVVDDLEAAESALQAARALADRFDARIILVSVSDAAEAESSDPAEVVARISMDEAADLIIVGARRGLRPGSFRSPLAQDLTITAPCPVVIAPQQAHPG